MGLRGPKKGVKYEPTIKKEMMREYLRERVAQELDPMISAMVDKAKGALVLNEETENGERVYRLPPSEQAFKALTDQAMGKPKEELDITTKGKSLSPTPEQVERFAKRHAKSE